MKNHQLVKILPLVLLLIAPIATLQCLNFCKECSNAFTCDICAPDQNCCSSTCATCVNGTVCTSCNAGYTLNQASNICQAQNPCDSACSECTKNKCQ